MKTENQDINRKNVVWFKEVTKKDVELVGGILIKSIFLSFLFNVGILSYASAEIPQSATPVEVGFNVAIGVIIIGLIPTIIVEALVIWAKLKTQDRKLRFFLASLAANLGSAITNIFILRYPKSFFELISGNKADYNNYPQEVAIWLVLTLVLAFLISILFENMVLQYFFKQINKKIIGKTVFQANLISYLLLSVFAIYGFVEKFIN